MPPASVPTLTAQLLLYDAFGSGMPQLQLCHKPAYKQL
jgi:hypothetical protein